MEKREGFHVPLEFFVCAHGFICRVLAFKAAKSFGHIEPGSWSGLGPAGNSHM